MNRETVSGYDPARPGAYREMWQSAVAVPLCPAPLRTLLMLLCPRPAACIDRDILDALTRAGLVTQTQGFVHLTIYGVGLLVALGFLV